MVENKITIPYHIKGIKPSDKKEGYVEVLMEPVDKIEYTQDEKKAAKHAEVVSSEVAQICNITIDWDKVTWRINWSDGTGTSTHA